MPDGATADEIEAGAVPDQPTVARGHGVAAVSTAGVRSAIMNNWSTPFPGTCAACAKRTSRASARG